MLIARDYNPRVRCLEYDRPIEPSDWRNGSSAFDRRAFLKTSLGATALLTTARANRAQDLSLFRGFRTQRIQTSGASIHTVIGGSGPPLLLIHGYPQTHVEWHKIAAPLAERFTVVMPDLRGYGDSSKPPDGENHANYSR